MSFQATIVLLVAALVASFFVPFITLIVGILGIIFVEAYCPTRGDYDFGPIVPIVMNFIVVIASLMVLAVRFFG